MSTEQTEPKPEKTVTMLFPHRVVLTLAHGVHTEFTAGVHEVKESLADHWYLKANGAKKYEPNALAEAAKAEQAKAEEAKAKADADKADADAAEAKAKADAEAAARAAQQPPAAPAKGPATK